MIYFLGEIDKDNTLQAEGAGMTTLRDISVRFFKLTLSQKAAIAGKLGLLEDDDIDQPDFERFRRVFLRAYKRNLITELDAEITTILSQDLKKIGE